MDRNVILTIDGWNIYPLGGSGRLVPEELGNGPWALHAVNTNWEKGAPFRYVAEIWFNRTGIALVLKTEMLDLMGYDLTAPSKAPIVISTDSGDSLGKLMHFAECWLKDEDWREKAADPSFMDCYTMEKVDGFTES